MSWSLDISTVAQTVKKTNHRNFWKILEEAAQLNKPNILIVGDFNSPKIDRRHWSTPRDGAVSEEFQLVETIRHMYLRPHVDRLTRRRATNQPELLYLELSNEEGMVDHIFQLSPMGKNDQSLPMFQFELMRCKKAARRFIYDKWDYNMIKICLGMRIR